MVLFTPIMSYQEALASGCPAMSDVRMLVFILNCLCRSPPSAAFDTHCLDLLISVGLGNDDFLFHPSFNYLEFFSKDNLLTLKYSSYREKINI